jgi:rubredoxin
MTEQSTAMTMSRCRCKACTWIFDLMVAPLLLTAAARVMASAHCPMCGNGGGNTIAPNRPLTEEELQHKLSTMPPGLP